MGVHTYSFEKLEVWQDALKWTVSVYRLTALFPDDEKFGLTSQLRRAAVSVSSNIAEGNSRSTHKEKQRFFSIAYSSLMEVISQLLVARELAFIGQVELDEIRLEMDKIANKLNALHNAFRPKN